LLRKKETGPVAAIHVTLFGRCLVWLKDAGSGGALALPEHVDEDGNLKLEHAFSDSFAHVGDDGKIRRYGEVIGSVSDLVVLPG
jgi:hypothetical protein